jgi:dihydrofolate synthase/folylpolyglutamate synthase
LIPDIFPVMNYQETINYLYTRLPVFSRIGAAALKPSLDNTIALCDFLDNPERKFKTIHIAGTNGKGSVSHMLAAVLQAAGYKTGLYTSPHLKDFRERIKINGSMIAEEVVVDFTRRIQPSIETLNPSFFEITVAMAFDHFAQEEVDIAVIETGLGGRLDSTNIITPEISVITTIGWDHMNLLGDTLEKIAAEKGGIIKQNIPVVLGNIEPVAKAVLIDMAAAKQADCMMANEQFQVTEWSWQQHQLVVQVAAQHHVDRHTYTLDLPGIYQKENLVTVLAVVSQLQQLGWTINQQQLQLGLAQAKKTTGLHGRWELLQQHPDIIADVAHNEQGMQMLLQQLEVTTYQHLHIITGMVADKEVDKVLSLMPRQANYYFTQANIPRALPAADLKGKAVVYGLKGEVYDNVNAAITAAKQQAHANDLILVCGSVFLVGEIN